MSDRISPEKQQRIDFESQFIKFEMIDLLSKTILDELECWANENIFKPLGGNLTVQRPLNESVNACAIANPKRPVEAVIKINMGMIREIYRDSFVFPPFSEQFVKDSSNVADLNAQFRNLGFTFGSGLPVIPRNKRNAFYFSFEEVYVGKNERFTEDATACRCMYFEVALAWVFFHELSHLVQCHYKLKNQLSADTDFIEFYELNSSDSSSEENSREQSREILADMEGIDLTLKYMIRKDIFSAGALYIFMCALGCLYNRFYNGYPEKIDIGQGSHPHPIIRHEFSVAFIANAISQKLIEMGYAKDKESVGIAIVYLSVRANLLSGIYWGWRYEDRDKGGLTSFMKYSTTHDHESRNACCLALEVEMNNQLVTIASNHLMRDNFLASLSQMKSFFGQSD